MQRIPVSGPLSVRRTSREESDGGLRRRDWNPATATTLVGMGRTDDFKAMRTTIGVEERKLLSEVLDQPLPAEMADLLKQLDQPTEGNFDASDGAGDP